MYLIIFTILSAISTLLTPTYALSANDYRLPRNIIPTAYKLRLTADPLNETFSGVVTIDFDTVSTSNGTGFTNFEIHAATKFIKINSILLSSVTECSVLSQNSTTDIAVIDCTIDFTKLADKARVLEITYQGTFSTEDMYGFYKSTYTEDGVNKTLVATQFEQMYARRAFPCFDEPDLKASFSLTLEHPTNYTALSNTNTDFVAKAGELTVTAFETTPKMSTYLLAFSISEFKEFVNENLNETYDFAVYARSEAADYTETAVKYGPKLLDLLSTWTGIPYNSLGNSKMDLVAIPDFAAGAMENWGLITYREVDLLDEGNRTSTTVKQNVITVIAHEFAHQWFGDYVTLQWWSETWLNEGFATYFQYHIANELPNENLELDKQFVTLVHQAVMQTDSLPSSQPLSSKDSSVYTPAQAANKFGSISYSKGGSVLRMIKYILGETNFQKGLQTYLQTYNYSNTVASDLLNSLQTVVTDKEVNLTKYLQTWIYESGFPLVKVSLNNNSDKFVTIETQKQFLSSVDNTASKTWFVPLTYTLSKSPDFNTISVHWLDPSSQLLLDITSDEWIIVNLQASGFYRVNYDTTLWSRIIKALKSQQETVHVLNRAQLLDDIFNIASIGDVSYSTAFELAEYLENETEYYPWYSAFTAFTNILDKLHDQTLLQEVILKWLDNIVEIPLPGSNSNDLGHIDILKRNLILEWACKLGHAGCVQHVKDQFAYYKASTYSLTDYNLRNLIFCNGLRYSQNTSEDFDYLFKIYENSNSPNEKISLLNSMACAEDATVLQKYLGKTIVNGSSIRKQDAAKVFSAVYSTSQTGVDVALNFLEENAAKMATIYKGMSAIGDIITGIAKKLSTEDQVSTLKNILSQNQNIEDITLVQDLATDLASSNLKWVEAYSTEIQDVLSKVVSTTTTSVTDSTTDHPGSASTQKLNTGSLLVLVCVWIYNNV